MIFLRFLDHLNFAHFSRHQLKTKTFQSIHNVVSSKTIFLPFRHIKEHYEGKMQFNDSDMTPEELEFHYFK